MSSPRILIYLMRRDLRIQDNPILNEISRLVNQSASQYTHLLPLYIFSHQQIEVSGFLSSPDIPSPFPESRSQIAGFWRCGPHRATFLAESLWDVKKGLESIGSGLELRVGKLGDTLKSLADGLKSRDAGSIAAVWITSEEGVEEKREVREIRVAVKQMEGSVDFKLWNDEKYFIDDRDLPFQSSRDLPDVFTTYRKTVEPLRDAPRKTLPQLEQLLPLPPSIPPQDKPFLIPFSLDGLISALQRPLKKDCGLKTPPSWPSESTKSAHPFKGGETNGHGRIRHLIESGAMSAYKDTRNGLLGEDFSTKLSAWLALGCINARQIHEYMMEFEEGTTLLGKNAVGYGQGENKGTAAVRFELLWRDYMRLCTRKFGPRLFRLEGFRDDSSYPWKSPQKDPEVQHTLQRFLEGCTGTGLIDASLREVYLTGYTSNRARQNVASFLSKHLGIDWRIGAEWYEYLLVDYDLSSNWGNWQYTAGVGNDPRGEARVFNPVKQSFDYDSKGEYVKAWVPELSKVEDPMEIFQAWRIKNEDRKRLDLIGVDWVERPLKKIEFHLTKGKGGGSNGGGRGRGRGYRGRGGRGGGGNFQPRGQGRGGKGDLSQN